MKDDELRQLLEELHQKIESTDSVDEKGRELLSHLSADIRNLLERTGHEGQLRGTSREVGRIQAQVVHAMRDPADRAIRAPGERARDVHQFANDAHPNAHPYF